MRLSAAALQTRGLSSLEKGFSGSHYLGNWSPVDQFGPKTGRSWSNVNVKWAEMVCVKRRGRGTGIEILDGLVRCFRDA